MGHKASSAYLMGMDLHYLTNLCDDVMMCKGHTFLGLLDPVVLSHLGHTFLGLLDPVVLSHLASCSESYV